MKNLIKFVLVVLVSIFSFNALGTISAQEIKENGGSEVVSIDSGMKASNVGSSSKGIATKSVTSSSYDGGYWIRGNDGGNLISSYKNYKKSGHASVVNGSGTYVSGGWQRADVFSNAKGIATPWGKNQTYYNYR